MQPNWQQQQQQLQGGFYNPQQQQPQQTGFGLQSQQTGFPGQQRTQPTGLPSGNLSFLNAPPPSFGGGGMGGGMAPQMTGYPGGGASGLMPQQTGFGGMGGMRPQPTGFGGGMMSQPTGMMGQQTGLMSQPTGMGGLRAQPTGYQDPRLQSMMQSFMPSNLSQPFTSSGVPQFNQAPQNQPLAHTFQSLIQNPTVKTPKVPWTLTKQEKKDYDQIFRAWEKGDGFVSGETAREVFGQSGLNQDDMIKIWTLSDVDNRGKLNLPEFHVAMGLIYRALNGNEIPDKLPEEMVPPSMRDIDTTVNFMRDLLKHESSTRSTASSPGYGSASYANQSKDATAYKHDDTRSSSAYKPSSRHIDRKSVRYAGEESGAEIGDIRRQLQNTSAMLDKSNSEYDRKTDEDERLEQEVDDLKYRVKRLQEDIDYVSKGRRSAEKDEERRKLERELLFLMHEKLPELERRQEQREEEKRREERAGIRARDRRNDTHGRYDDRDREKDDHAWLKGSYDRDRRDSRDSFRRDDRDREYGRRDSRDRDYDRGSRRDDSRERDYRPRSPPASRTPPPAPPPPVTSAPAPPAPPKPTKTPDVPNTKNMTPEERTAFIREQAQRRIQERLRALGVESASETPVVDKSVEERLAQEKKEAEEKSRSADEEQKAREQARQARLAGTTTAKEEAKDDVKTSPEAPKGILKGKTGPPPPPTSRAKQPPKPPAPRGAAAPPAPAPPAQQAEPEDQEEAEFRRREEAIKKAKEDRRRRLEQLEREEEEERQRESAASSRTTREPEIAAPVPVPAAPPAPPAPTTSAPSVGGYNPFRKPSAGAAAPPAIKSPPPPAVPSPGGFNPFFKPQAAKDASAGNTPVTSPPAAPAPPPPPPAPPAPAPPAQAPIRSPPPADDGWESIHEKEAESDSDSSDDDDYAKSRDNRRNLASALFGGLGGGSNSSPTTSRPGSAAPKPPAALKNIGGGDPNAGRGALLSAIAGGARLKKTQTVVKGGPVAGKVIGDAEPPAHINAAPVERQRSPSPPPAPESNGDGFEEDFQPRGANRQSVDWYAGLAADQTHPSTGYEPLEATREESAEAPAAAPETHQADEEDELADFDMTTSIRVRTLFPYEGQRDVDLSFNENMVVIAHPAKDSSSPWWYGLLVDGGNKGWFPHDYVTKMQHVKAKALYSYAGSTPEELPFAEGDELIIVDQSEDDWWKVEKAGVIFIVPASYLETQG